MKKILLLAAAACMAASASAEVFPAAAPVDGVDLTPAGYKYNTWEGEFIGVNSPQVLAWNIPVSYYMNNFINGDQAVNDGYIILTGDYYNGKPENAAKFMEGVKIIDMGGTCGKVLAINFHGSEFPAKYKALTGKDLEIGAAPGAYPLMFYFFDHNMLAPYAGIEKNTPLRVRFEMNMFANIQAETGEYWKCYANDDANNVHADGDNGAADILVNPSEFAYRWCDYDETTPNDDNIWDDGPNQGAGEWNPNRWLVYEWDVDIPSVPEDPTEAWQYNLKLKNEIPGGNVCNFTLLIRNVQIYAPTDTNRERFTGKRSRTWNTYTVGDDSGIENIEAVNNAPVEYFNLQGIRVANPENGMYIMRQGNKVSKIVK